MTAIKVNPNTTKFYVPDHLVCRIKPDPELVSLCQKTGDAIHRGTAIGKLKDLWPSSGLKESILSQAKEFVSQMALQGNILQGSIYEIEVWGPYRDRPLGAEEVNIEEGNPFSAAKNAIAAKGVWSPETTGVRKIDKDLLDRYDFRHGICYRIRGLFLKTRGKQEETTGVVIL